MTSSLPATRRRAARPAEPTRNGLARAVATLVTAAALSVSIAACGSSHPSASSSKAATKEASSSSSGVAGHLDVGYFTGLIAEPETVIGSDKSLEADIGTTLKFVPITAGVTALAEMRGGSLNVVAGVGNPPVVAAIAEGTPIDVVWAQSFDADELIVPDSITSPQELAGKTLGDLEGSSEAFEVAGYLSTEHLTSKVHVVGFASEQAAATAYSAGKLDAVYVEGAPAQDLLAKGNHALTNAKTIATLGFPSLDVLAVSQSLVKDDPTTVQKYVCTELTATKDLLGPDRDTYFKDSAKLLGVPADQAVTATAQYLSYYIEPSDELHWLVGTKGVSDGPMLESYVKTASFVKSEGSITTLPSAATIASHIDPTFAEKALHGGCS